jgi:hypothetical protein
MRIDALLKHSRKSHPDLGALKVKRRINSKDDTEESARPDTSSDVPTISSSPGLQNTFVAQYDPVVASAETSDDEGSIFSVASLGSSATDLSRASGFSEMEIASASRELISVFCDDELLQGLYAMAIQNMIGRRRFANNFQRLLKIYAKNLEEEGMDRLDYLASQLVALQARCVARSIVDRYWTDLEPTTANENEDSAQPRNESSSDEEDSRGSGINGTVFEELINFRGFLVESAAFEQFYTNLQQFVSSPMPMTKKSMKHVTQPDSGTLDLVSTFGTAHNDSVQPTILSDHFAGISTEYSMHRRIMQMLENDAPLLLLHTSAMAGRRKDVFVREYSHVLRSFYENQESKTLCENDVREGSLIEAAPNWLRLAHRIVQDLQTIPASGAGPHEEVDEKTAATKSDPLDYINKQPMQAEITFKPSNGYEHSIEPLANVGPQELIGVPQFKLDLQLLVLPQNIRSIIQSAPRSVIKISSDNSPSRMNPIKTRVENFTKVEWDWWPLSPRIPDVVVGQSRLEWTVSVLWHTMLPHRS